MVVSDTPLHVRLEALCASMQRHGVSAVDLDGLRLYVHRLLETTENRLRALRPGAADGAITRPDAPASITQRLRALADDPPESEEP